MGCKNEIQELKSQIVTLQQKGILQVVAVVCALDEIELRAQWLEIEAQQLKKNLVEFYKESSSTKEK